MSFKLSRITKFVDVLRRSVRIFPYFSYLFNFFPFFCILYSQGSISSPSAFLLLAPFVMAMAGGFMFNTICDSSKDPEWKNTITSKELPKSLAAYLTAVFCAISLVLFLLLFKSLAAILLSNVYILIWLAYSGLRVRFKETYLAPLVASFVLWVGGPLILLTEFNCFTLLTITLLVGMFFCFCSFEIYHTVVDYKDDLAYNCQTLAVRLGVKNALILKHISLALGSALLLFSIYFFNINPYLFLLFTSCSIGAQALLIGLDKLEYDQQNFYNLTRKAYTTYFFASPFFISRFLLLLLGLAALSLPPELSFLFIWVFAVDKTAYV